ncbi:MAG: hypothetical protein GY778_25750 [bacterium]|nr:hypothetical protein [bacterium]
MMGPVPGSFLSLVADVLAVEGIDPAEAAEIDEEGNWHWLVEPEPILGMKKYLDSDAEIGRLRGAGRLTVELVENLTHTTLVVDGPTLDATVGRVLAVLTRPGEGPDAAGTPIGQDKRPMDPLRWAAGET